jgi:hypothetical protein
MFHTSDTAVGTLLAQFVTAVLQCAGRQGEGVQCCRQVSGVTGGGVLLLLLLTATELSLGSSSPYTSTDSCHSVAAVVTPVQTVVTRWQQSLHQNRQNKED